MWKTVILPSQILWGCLGCGIWISHPAFYRKRQNTLLLWQPGDTTRCTLIHYTNRPGSQAAWWGTSAWPEQTDSDTSQSPVFTQLLLMRHSVRWAQMESGTSPYRKGNTYLVSRRRAFAQSNATLSRPVVSKSAVQVSKYSGLIFWVYDWDVWSVWKRSPAYSD